MVGFDNVSPLSPLWPVKPLGESGEKKHPPQKNRAADEQKSDEPVGGETGKDDRKDEGGHIDEYV